MNLKLKRNAALQRKGLDMVANGDDVSEGETSKELSM
jgi:hypothetical protein